MSIKKIVLGFALAGMLGATSMVAEDNGVFIGVQGANGSTKMEAKDLAISVDSDGFRFGFVVGYKHFFNEMFGLRYYGMLDYGTNSYDYVGDVLDTHLINVNANVDALFDFFSNDTVDVGIFGGLSLGMAAHIFSDADVIDNSPVGFDAGINLGARVNLAGHHGIELFTRIGLSKQSADGDNGLTLDASQPYQVGLRYAFSF